jgi:ABC-type sugar transport system ATPase subunit
MEADSLILRSEEISKRFGGVQALDRVRFDLRRGEVHALVGENGAGKSTYIKILCGVYQKDAGTMWYDGQEIHFRDNLEARQNGIGIVPQQIELAPKLTVGENIFMGLYPRGRTGLIRWKELYGKARDIARTFSIEHLINLRVESLGTGHRQLIEILKALVYDTRIIAFDEPTAALSEEETRELFALIDTLKRKGISIIYVSHRLEEIFLIADRVTVFKDGHYVGTREIASTSKAEVVSMMVGRELDLFGEDRRATGRTADVVFEARNLVARNVRDVSFALHRGEILGMFGMVGSGRTETVMAVFGENPLSSGDILVRGDRASIRTPETAVRLGIGLVPENRITQGVILRASVRNNISLPLLRRLSRFGVVNQRMEQAVVREYVNALKIKTPSATARTLTLSGGNQQKVAIAKWLATRSDIIIFDEPTHGIDVGAKHDIYQLLRELSDEGKAIIMISSELPEILNVCDRILVFRDGRIVQELEQSAELTEEIVVQHALG